jgi:hypothetical protein
VAWQDLQVSPPTKVGGETGDTVTPRFVSERSPQAASIEIAVAAAMARKHAYLYNGSPLPVGGAEFPSDGGAIEYFYFG